MKRYPLAAFFGLTLVLSWGIWLPAAAALHGRVHLPVSANSAQLLGAFGPGLAALVVAAALGGASYVRKMFEGLLLWRVGVAWYLIALFLPATLSLLTTALHMMCGGDAPDFSDPPIYRATLPTAYAQYNAWTLVVPVFLQHLVLGSSLTEEIGWRGFALPRLQKRHNALVASVILSGMWGLWALPLYWINGWVQADERALLLLGIVPATILSTWIFNNTQGSLLLVLFFNTAAKITDLFVAAPPAHPIMTVMSYSLVTALVIVLGGPARLSRQTLSENCRSPEDSVEKSMVGTATRV